MKTNNDIPPGILKPLAVDQIRAEADVQARVEMNLATITVYFERMMEGDKFPPVIVFDDGKELWLADGFHRLAAAKRACRKQIDARVIKGSHDDAAWFALGANRINGLPMSTADKMRAIKQALLLRAHESNNVIAQHIGVSDHTVAKYRREMESTSQIAKFDKRLGADGKERPAVRHVDDDPPPPPPSTTVATPPPPPISPEVEAAKTEVIAAFAEALKLPPPNPNATNDCNYAQAREAHEAWINSPKDRVGNPITDPTIAEIFARDRELVELCTAVSKVKTTVLKAAETGDPLYAGIQTGQFKADAENLRRQIDHLRPCAICPYCKAVQPQRQSCEACRGRGWVNQTVYGHAPADKK